MRSSAMREFVLGMLIALGYLAALIVAGTCLHGCVTDPTPAPNGEECALDEDCESSLCLDSLGDGTWPFPGVCTEECTSDSCPDGSTCLTFNLTSESYCYSDCESDLDCAEGWDCVTITHDGLRSCVPDL